MMYEYACDCGATSRQTSTSAVGIGHVARFPCQSCGGRMRRSASFQYQRPMQPHYNPAVGRVVSSNKDFEDELKRKSDDVSIRTGMEHNFVPYDMRERDGIGVTDEGLDATYRQQRDSGQTPSTSTIIT